MAELFSIGEIVKATGGIPAGTTAADTRVHVPGISTDTRTLGSGDAFFALIGENHDAHDHLEEAAAKGAAILVVSDISKAPDGYDGVVLVVDDTLRAYQELAAYHRQKIDPFIIAVTGSVGKTTMKDMIGCIMSERFRAYYTQGNFNNHIGLPRTILEAAGDTEVLVLEMGMSHAGEISRLCEIALPDVSVITNIGMSHRENFDSDEGILNAKYEIAAFLGEDGVLVIDAGGYPGLDRIATEDSIKKGYKLLRVAAEDMPAAEYSDFIVSEARVGDEDAAITSFEVWERQGGEAVHFAIPVPGVYAGISAALAAAACTCAGIPLADSAKALVNLKRTAHRLDPIMINGILVIDDTYNASPDSVKSGLEYLKNVKAEKRIAVLADMNELGGDSEAMHREVGSAAVIMGTEILYTYGEKARWIADGAEAAVAGGQFVPKILWYGPDEKEKMMEHLCSDIRKGCAIYVKGSRSMKMEEVVSALTGYAADAEDEDDPS